MNTRGPLRLVAAVAVTIILAACSGTRVDDVVSATPPPTVVVESHAASNEHPKPGQKVSRDVLTVQVTGSCDTDFKLDASGFIPSGRYTTSVVTPDGKDYGYIVDGYADQDGHAPGWTWNCALGNNGRPDPEGVYYATITDTNTGRNVTAAFKVQYNK